MCLSRGADAEAVAATTALMSTVAGNDGNEGTGDMMGVVDLLCAAEISTLRSNKPHSAEGGALCELTQRPLFFVARSPRGRFRAEQPPLRSGLRAVRPDPAQRGGEKGLCALRCADDKHRPNSYNL